MIGKIILTAGIAATGLAMGTASPALADQNDDIFISVIDGEAIPYSSVENAIVLAHAVCDYVAAGQAPEQVAIEISGPANWSIEQSGFFVGAATQVYCPPADTAPAATPAPAPVAQEPFPVVQPPVEVYPQATIPPSVYFSNCAAARSAGAAPLYAGAPGYRGALDRDGDGVACE